MAKKVKTVLVVEDEEPILKAIEDKFTQEGFSVLRAKDGREGLDSALKNKPDVILLDILMPNMDGLAMLVKLRDDKWGKKVPVFILTNYGDIEKISSAMQSGISGYLIKTDWRLEEVVDKVKVKLGMKNNKG